ncbi:MAG: hypothetical protein H8D47_02475 [Planctomycetes bacterium]|nr:hypothetical protein [Planctomycetota bacterium]
MVFYITLASIVTAALFGLVIKRIHKDKCLKDLANDMVTLQLLSNLTCSGKLIVQNSGLEILYPHKNTENGFEQSSYLLYSNEFASIYALLRFHDELCEKAKTERNKELKKTYHPKFFRRLTRKFINILKLLKDAVVEISNALITRAKQSSPIAGTLSTQDKYISQMKQNLIGSAGTSYEPLLERYIGHKVILELTKSEKIFHYSGVLKDYSADFIEIMDVDYKLNDQLERKADIVVLRKYGIVRHLGE